MKEKELSSADKCRRTKLCKKSIEELINIVLRKDDIERKLSKSVATFKKLQEINDKRINTLQDSLNKSEEIQLSQDKTITALNSTLDVKFKRISILEDEKQALSSRILGEGLLIAIFVMAGFYLGYGEMKEDRKSTRV